MSISKWLTLFSALLVIGCSGRDIKPDLEATHTTQDTTHQVQEDTLSQEEYTEYNGYKIEKIALEDLTRISAIAAGIAYVVEEYGGYNFYGGFWDHQRCSPYLNQYIELADCIELDENGKRDKIITAYEVGVLAREEIPKHIITIKELNTLYFGPKDSTK